MTRAAELHKSAIIFDGTCPMWGGHRYVDHWIKGGVTVMAPTLAGVFDDCRSAMVQIGQWFSVLEQRRTDLLHVTKVEHFREAKRAGKLGILFHFQNASPMERNIELVEVFARLGVRVVQLCNNVKGYVGDGCTEPGDGGLSEFGVRLIREMNRTGIAVDGSHTGVRTTLEAMDVSDRPLVFSHANVRAICNSPRNLTDEQIRKVGKTGGVIGVVGYPAFVSDKPRPVLDDMLRHVDYIAEKIGVDHVGLGVDFFYPATLSSIEEATRAYTPYAEANIWKRDTYPAPPWHFPEGLEDPRGFPRLTEALLARGYDEADARKILGENFMRVYEKIWK